MIIDPQFHLHYITDLTQKATIGQQLIDHYESLELVNSLPQLDDNDPPPPKRRRLPRGSFMKSLDKSSETTSNFRTIEQEVDLWLGQVILKCDANVYQ